VTQVFARLETVKRSPTWGAVAKLGYLCRRGRFAAREDLVAGPRQVLPPSAPRRFRREVVLWSEADAAERPGNVAAVEIVLALPLDGCSRHDWIEIALIFAQIIAYHYGVAITVVVHAGTNAGDGADANPHAHLLITSRAVTPQGLAPRRIDALLPTMTGWRRGAAIIPIAVDAAPIATLYRCTLGLYFSQQGKKDALDLNPPHAQIHVGPTAAVGARIANSEDISRLPNAAEIFDKLERIEINTEIAARNLAAIRNIDGLVDHLSGTPFTKAQLARLVDKHIKSPLEAKSIVEAVLDQCHCFTENGESVGDLLVTEHYLQREASIARLASALGSPWSQGNNVLADPSALGEALKNRGGIAIVELPANGLQVAEVATGLVRQGLVQGVALPVALAHEVVDLAERLLGEVHRVGPHVGDEPGLPLGSELDPLVQLLGDGHRLLGREPQLARRLLLEGRGRERRGRVALDLLAGDVGDRPALHLENGYTEELVSPSRSLEAAVVDILWRCILFDSLTRMNGYVTFPLYEYE
jgi:hypothetical protein